MRKQDTIYNIKPKFNKIWLPGGKSWKDMFCKIYEKIKKNITVIQMINL